jgi:quercetin dioxygenase-like cupin family protein
MASKFRIAGEIAPDKYDWGIGRWVSHPASTGTKQLTVLNATLAPGKGHSFHKHPDQEEVMYVVAGKVEQWVDREMRILGSGDAAFIPAGMVHASFNVGEGDAKLFVIFSPCVGDIGYETVDVAGEAPWKGLRA